MFIFIPTDDIAYNQMVPVALKFFTRILYEFYSDIETFPLHFKVIQEILMSKYQMLLCSNTFFPAARY